MVVWPTDRDLKNKAYLQGMQNLNNQVICTSSLCMYIHHFSQYLEISASIIFSHKCRKPNVMRTSCIIDLSKNEPRENWGRGEVKEILKDKFIYLSKEGRVKDLKTHLFCMLTDVLPPHQLKGAHFSRIVFFF